MYSTHNEGKSVVAEKVEKVIFHIQVADMVKMLLSLGLI